jgi:hypothetical protein
MGHGRGTNRRPVSLCTGVTTPQRRHETIPNHQEERLSGGGTDGTVLASVSLEARRSGDEGVQGPTRRRGVGRSVCGDRPVAVMASGASAAQRKCVVVYWRGRRRAMFGAIVAVLIPLSSVVAAQAETFGRTLTDSPLRSDPFVQQGPLLTWSGPLPLECARDLGGKSVALAGDGSTLFVGNSCGPGAALVYTRSGSSWPELVELHPTDAIGTPGSPAAFGGMIALSHDGNTALIGGRGDNGGHGAAWVFTREGSTWTQQGRKLPGTEFASCGSGVSLSSDGNTALMGCPGGGRKLAGVSPPGSAYFFTRSGATWTQQGPEVTGSGGSFGASVTVSGDGGTALVGANAPCWSEPCHSPPPTATVFVRSGSEWVQQGPPLSVASAPWEGNGLALSSDGNTALVGESVFVRSGSTWTKQAQFSGSSSLGQGVALSANGNLALLSENSAASVFVRSGSSWSLREIVKPSTEGRYFGLFAALSSDASTAAIGGYSGAWVFVGQAKKAKEIEGTCSVVNVGTGLSYRTLQGAVDSVPLYGGSKATLSVTGTCYGDTDIYGYRILTIVGRGHATLDGGNSEVSPGSVVSVIGHYGGSTVAITGLTITGGYDDRSRYPEGAGIFNVEGEVTLNDSTVTGNRGGGIGIGEGGVTLNNSTVAGNTTSGSGGGISNNAGGVTLNDSTVAGNSASGCGGGLFNHGAPGEITLNDSNVTRNKAAGNGGGICDEGDPGPKRQKFGITLNGSSSVSRNTASGNGGGIYNGDVVTLNDSSSVTRNTASGKGGGIYNDETDGFILSYGIEWNGTVSGNKPDDIFNF